MSRLTPNATATVPVDVATLTEDGLTILDRFSGNTLLWGLELADRLVEGVMLATPMLADEATLPRVFLRGVRSSVFRVIRIVGGESLEPITDEGADVARDFARRGLELTTLLRCIRIGTAIMAAAHIAGASEFLRDDQRAREIQRLSELFFVYVERFSSEMSEAYGLERDRWLSSKAAERLVFVNDLLAGRPVDHRAMSRALDYDLDATHIALIAWAEHTNVDESELLAIASVDALHASGATATVVIPVGIGATWAWGAVTEEGATAPSRPPPGVLTARSQVHAGATGFLRAYREARSVENLMRLSGPELPRAVRHADVELATLLVSDLEGAQYFVRRQLGRLALDDARTQQVRETLRLYLEHERSVTKVAELQFVARNTVTYRIKQAEELSGKRIDDDRLNLQSALLLTNLLGARVLIRH